MFLCPYCGLTFCLFKCGFWTLSGNLIHFILTDRASFPPLLPYPVIIFKQWILTLSGMDSLSKTKLRLHVILPSRYPSVYKSIFQPVWHPHGPHSCQSLFFFVLFPVAPCKISFPSFWCLRTHSLQCPSYILYWKSPFWSLLKIKMYNVNTWENWSLINSREFSITPKFLEHFSSETCNCCTA